MSEDRKCLYVGAYWGKTYGEDGAEIKPHIVASLDNGYVEWELSRYRDMPIGGWRYEVKRLCEGEDGGVEFPLDDILPRRVL